MPNLRASEAACDRLYRMAMPSVWVSAWVMNPPHAKRGRLPNPAGALGWTHAYDPDTLTAAWLR
jgi:hypothetical protein